MQFQMLHKQKQTFTVGVPKAYHAIRCYSLTWTIANAYWYRPSNEIHRDQDIQFSVETMPITACLVNLE